MPAFPDPGISVESFVLCEWATWDEHQRPTIHGLLQIVEVPEIPCVRDVIGVIFCVWGPPNAVVKLRLRVEGPPGSKKFAEPREFDLPLDEQGMRGVGATLEQLQLTAAGDHSVVVVHEGAELARRRFRVVVRPPAGPGTTRTAGADG